MYQIENQTTVILINSCEQKILVTYNELFVLIMDRSVDSSPTWCRQSPPCGQHKCCTRSRSRPPLYTGSRSVPCIWRETHRQLQSSLYILTVQSCKIHLMSVVHLDVCRHQSFAFWHKLEFSPQLVRTQSAMRGRLTLLYSDHWSSHTHWQSYSPT